MEKNIRHRNITNYLNSTGKIIVFTAILYFIIGKISLFIFLPKSNILPYFPAIGFAISATLLFGRKALSGVAIGSLLLSTSLYLNDFQSATTFEEFSRPLALCIIRPIMFCINASLVSYFTQLWCKKNYPFDSEKNVLFFAIACLLGTFISISIGMIAIGIISYFSIDECFVIWGNMLRGNIMGAILFTPFAHSWLYATNELSGWSAAKKVEAALLILSTLALSLFIFETHISNESVLFFLLMWAASRFGMKIITLIITIITVIAIYCTAHYKGGFAFRSWDNDFFLLQLFLFVNMVSILFFKAILMEKEGEKDKLKISEEKYRAIYESFEDIYFKKTLDGLLLDVSPSVEKYFNMKKEDVIGINAYDFYADRAEGELFYEAILHNKQVHDFEERFLNANGKIIHFSVSAKLVNDSNGQPAYIEGTMRDISERIENRKKLQEGDDKIKRSEEKFRSIFENMQDIYYQHNFDGTITEISPSCEKHFKRKREEMIGFNTTNLYYDPVRRNEFRKMIIKEGCINDEHVQFVTATGEPIFFSVNCKIIYDQDGMPSHVEGSMRNINERILSQKQLLEANEKIKESEKKFRNIFENARDVFFMESFKEDKLIDISPSCSYFGVQPEEIIGKSIGEFYFDPEDREEVLETRIKLGGIKDYVVKYIFKGITYHVLQNSKIIYDENNEPEFIIGSFTDVTDRIQAEENLKLSEAKFRSIYESFDDVYFKTKIDGTITEVSPSFEKHLLIPSEQALGSSVLDLYYNKKDREFLLKKLKADNYVSDFDVQFIDVNGNQQFFSINAHLLYEGGVATYIEGTLRNINDRIAVQKEMLSKNRKLEFQNTELEQFAYIASHDLQEPLITVSHSIQMLEEELGENLNDNLRPYLEFINNSTSRMQLLVKGLLDYSRIGKERKSCQIDCNEIVAHVLTDMEASLKESKANVQYENLPVIESNTTEMRQLFQNLISNGNKFRKKHEPPIIKISAVKEGKNWVFSVRDNGIGIEEHNLDKIFVIFKRLHNRHEYEGTGIGLSHCKKIIEHHKGKIWVESVYNEGSTFKWTLPIE